MVRTRRAHLGPDRVEQQLAGSRDPAADDDPVRGDDRDHVADPDPEVAPDAREPVERPLIAGPGCRDGGFDGLGPAGLGDAVGPGEGLEAAVVAAVARRTVGVDDLVPDLTGRPVVTEMDVAVDGDDPADAGAKGQPDHRVRAAGGAQPQLGQAERPGVVDERAGDGERRRYRSRDGSALPVARHVDQEPGRAARRVV